MNKIYIHSESKKFLNNNILDNKSITFNSNNDNVGNMVIHDNDKQLVVKNFDLNNNRHFNAIFPIYRNKSNLRNTLKNIKKNKKIKSKNKTKSKRKTNNKKKN